MHATSASAYAVAAIQHGKDADTLARMRYHDLAHRSAERQLLAFAKLLTATNMAKEDLCDFMR